MTQIPLSADGREWQVKKIVVIGPGIVGTPMAALLASAPIRGQDPPEVVVVQRDSVTSGWKVGAINRGESPIGGVEPGLDRLIAEAVRNRSLRASHDYAEARDADVILVCVQTDKRGYAPDYGPLFEALTCLGPELQRRTPGHVPVIVFESTLAPSSMTTLVSEQFASFGLEDGRDLLLGNSPNRVMPGRLVERVTTSDKLVGGLRRETVQKIQHLYSRIVTGGTVHPTNSMTAEVVKTLENAYRDVRIAFSAEIARYCDDSDVDFYQVRDAINHRLAQADSATRDATAVPTGGLLVPTVGVGGHCLPKDGILLWWRRLEAGLDHANSLILEARRINDESPGVCIAQAERAFGSIAGRPVAILGTAYRFDSEDTRNSPSLALADALRAKGCPVVLHDPYVRPGDQNLLRYGLGEHFTNELSLALKDAEIGFLCTGHGSYRTELVPAMRQAPVLKNLFDACNFFQPGEPDGKHIRYAGIGRGRAAPVPQLLEFVEQEFHAMERGLSNELVLLIDFLNEAYAADPFNRIDFAEVQRLAGTCVTGCQIVDPGPIPDTPGYNAFTTRLADLARAAASTRLQTC
ncbi:MAG TPA: nucleotide sugar dehydrogenase [Gemmatimonadales bacterium]|nr:nucleotide sugar dehydrogenase [Gemmatimonadales bacterium]